MKLEKHKRVYIPNCEDGLVEDYNVVEDAYVLTITDIQELVTSAITEGHLFYDKNVYEVSANYLKSLTK